ncbi:hypothetical protein [Streptomyces sp. SID3343]|uniref:hypothetical protein n=1 Tax=Streptomyces sp. SID3343 TaxID=2690260 RepID=UPI00136CBC0C|nr:hypothetical protein [Streptomyces sp. SID3343]MYW01591.1 hypothetical protein [Streptomyces sp. SID3343]
METAPSPTLPTYTPPPATARDPSPGPWWRRPLLVSAEACVAILTAVVFAQWARTIRVNPLDRIGQVSALAMLQLRVAVIGIVVIAALVIAYRRFGPAWQAMVVRFSCAVVAGLMSGFIAAGSAVGLRGTPWPINGVHGDAGTLANWAAAINRGESLPSGVYPPLFPHVLAVWADVFRDGNTSYALQDLQIVIMALMAPAAYLAWRLWFQPLWALALGVTSAIPLYEPIKPYTTIVLVVFVPIIAKYIQVLRRTPLMKPRDRVLVGAGFGAILGILFISYSGWFVWSAAGVLVTCLCVLPWRSGLKAALTFAAATLVPFALIGGSYLKDLLAGAGGEKDAYFYFDTKVDPAYFLMWRGDAPGDAGGWPPPGELGGVGVFMLILLVGLALALYLGMRRSLVLALVACLGSSWLMRLWFSSHMFQDQAVQLYPRTSIELMYCFLLVAGVSAHLAAGRLRELWTRHVRHRSPAAGPVAPPHSGARWRTTPGMPLTIGALSALLFLFGSVASSIADDFMPVEGSSMANLTYNSHILQKADGKCPTWAPKHKCERLGTPPWKEPTRKGDAETG